MDIKALWCLLFIFDLTCPKFDKYMTITSNLNHNRYEKCRYVFQVGSMVICKKEMGNAKYRSQ